jgi:amino acid transporter
MAIMLAFGVLGQISAIVAGPSTGLLAVGKGGFLPPLLQKTNLHKIPISILLVQGILVTLLCTALVVLPSIQSAYQILAQMATIIYLLMSLLMFVAAISLRYSQPKIARPFKIPGGNFGIWFVATIGFLGSLIAAAFSFIPPKQIKTGSPTLYVAILLIGCVVFGAIPFVVYAFHKPTWKAADSDFEPFERQVKGRAGQGA